MFAHAWQHKSTSPAYVTRSSLMMSAYLGRLSSEDAEVQNVPERTSSATHPGRRWSTSGSCSTTRSLSTTFICQRNCTESGELRRLLETYTISSRRAPIPLSWLLALMPPTSVSPFVRPYRDANSAEGALCGVIPTAQSRFPRAICIRPLQDHRCEVAVCEDLV